MKKILLSTFLFLGTLCATAQQTISHSNNMSSVVQGGSVGCQNGVNNYSRSFVLSDFDITGDWNITQVEFGIQSLSAGVPLTITLSTTSQAYPGGYPGSLTTLATETVTFDADQEFSLVQVPIAVTVPGGSELVVEISGELFFIGGNSEGETASSYVWATGCALTTPTATSAIGFAGANIVINVTGNSDIAGINDSLASQFSVFPNPATNVINVTTDNALVSAVEIIDLNGRTVKSAKFDGVSEAQVNIADLSAGVYMMNVSSDKGMTTKKIVKN